MNASCPWLRSPEEWARWLASIDCPTLVCVGELDPATPVAAAREIADALPEGIARLEVIEGAGHFPWKDAPDRYWPLVTDFVMTTMGTKAPESLAPATGNPPSP